MRPRCFRGGNGLFASTYYFDPTAGNDASGTNSYLTPWASLSKLNALNLAPGDNVWLAGNKTFNGTLTLNNPDGRSAVNPVTIGSYNLVNGSPAYGTNRSTISSGAAGGLDAFNAGSGWKVSSLNFVGSGSTTNKGVSFYHTLTNTVRSGVTLSNMDISGYGADGVSIGSYDGAQTYYSAAATQGWKDVSISGVRSHNNGNAGIFVWGQTTSSNSNVAISNSTADNNGGDGILVANTDTATVERNIAHHNGLTQDGKVGIWAYDSNKITIQYNESYSQNTTDTHDGGGFDLDGGVTNSVVQYNYSHDNDGAGYLVGEYQGSKSTTGNTVRFNISQNDGRKNGYAGIFIYNFNRTATHVVTNNALYNNTVFNSAGGSNVRLEGNLQGLNGSTNLIANTILVTTGGIKLVNDLRGSTNTALGGATLINNDYWTSGSSFQITWGGTTYSSLSAWLDAFTTQERLDSNNDGLVNNLDARLALLLTPGLTAASTGGTIGDPNQLDTLGAYRLVSGSALRDAGLNLQSSPFLFTLGGTDYYGIPIPQGGGLTIGASEVAVPEPLAMTGTFLLMTGLLMRRRGRSASTTN